MKIRNYYSVGEQVDTANCTTYQDLSTFKIIRNPKTNLGESYRVRIQENKITITYDHPRGLRYAEADLNGLILQDKLYMGLIENGPRFMIRGIIEGFYGTPWTHEDRLDVIQFLHDNRMNAYMYAPKDDVYHRQKWRESYPNKELDKLVELIRSSHEKGIDFYFSISPGNDFNYTKEEDYNALFQKIDDVMSYGVTDFCLLLDDIDYTLADTDAEQFKTPGLAHAYITNRLNKHLQESGINYSLIMCPTEYWQRTNSPYRADLKQALDSTIMVFWTGYRVVAEYIPNMDGERANEYFGHDLVLWDNYPVNDMATDRLFMGPLVNRGDELDKTHVGMVSNPMVEWSLSKIPIITMSEYMWDPSTYDPESAFKRAIEQLMKHTIHQEALRMILPNFRHSLIHYYEDKQIEEYIHSKDIASLKEYYDQILQAIDILQSCGDNRFIEQFTPWLNRIKFDATIVEAIEREQYELALQKCKEAHLMDYTTGSNYAMKYAKAIGLYDGPIYKKERPNYWR